MVDFNNEATVSTPAVDVVRILILQRRSDLFEALERYNKTEYQGAQSDISIVRARLVSLFMELQAGIRRRTKDDKEYIKLKSKIYSSNPDNILEAIEYLNGYLDDMKLTRVDNKPNVNKKSWEAVNNAYGY